MHFSPPAFSRPQHASDPVPRPALDEVVYAPFLARLTTGAHLLEAGCGAGEDLSFFLAQGFKVTAFDASLSQARAASRLCGQPVRVCRFEQMQSVLPYDGIWASASLPCLGEHELVPTLSHLASLLKPGAPLYCSFPCPGDDATWLEDDYPLRTRLDETMLAMLVAPLPLALHQHWYSEEPRRGRWLHALLLRSL